MATTDYDRLLAAWAKVKTMTNTTMPAVTGRAKRARDRLAPVVKPA